MSVSHFNRLVFDSQLFWRLKKSKNPQPQQVRHGFDNDYL